MHKFAEMTFDDGLALVVETRAKYANSGLASLLANIPDEVKQQLIRAAIRGTAGAGIGAAVGGLSSLQQEKGRRTPWARAATGATIGGIGGGLGSLLHDASQSRDWSRMGVTAPAAAPSQLDQFKSRLPQESIPNVPEVRRRFRLDIDPNDNQPIVNPFTGKPVLLEDPQGDISVPQIGGGGPSSVIEPLTTSLSNVVQRPGSETASSLTGAGVGAAAGGAAGYVGGRAAAELPNPLQSSASALEKALASGEIKGHTKGQSEELKKLYDYLGADQSAAKKLLSQGSGAGYSAAAMPRAAADKIRAEIERLSAVRPGQDAFETALRQQAVEPQIKALQAMLAGANQAAARQDPHGLAELAAKKTWTPRMVKNVANNARAPIGHAVGLGRAGGVIGAIGGGLTGHSIHHRLFPGAAEAATKAQIEKLREAYDPSVFTSAARPSPPVGVQLPYPVPGTW